MADQQKQQITQDRFDGREEIFAALESSVRNGTLTLDAFNHEKNYWLSATVQQKSSSEIERFDAQSKAAFMREANKSAKELEATVISLSAALDKLPGQFGSLGEKLSKINQ